MTYKLLIIFDFAVPTMNIVAESSVISYKNYLLAIRKDKSLSFAYPLKLLYEAHFENHCTEEIGCRTNGVIKCQFQVKQSTYVTIDSSSLVWLLSTY